MYYENFRKLCEERGVKPAQVSRGTGIPTATLSSWKKGIYTPKQDKLQKIADFFNVPISDILSIDGIDIKDTNIIQKEYDEEDQRKTINLFTGSSEVRITKKIPVLGHVAAGIPINAVENIIDWEEISGVMALRGEYFGLRIQGDSMEPRMCNGDVVIIRQQPDAESGEYVIALVNGDSAVCKKLKKYEDGSLALISLNSAYSPMFFSASEVAELPVQILGKVVELRAKF